MRSYYAYYQIILSLTTVVTVVSSLATTSDGLNSNDAGGGDVIQSLMTFPPDSHSQSQWDDDPALLLGFDSKKAAIQKSWGEDADSRNNAWTEEPPLVAGESNYYYHRCSRVSKRQRGSTDYCSPIIDAPPLHFRRPSSEQEDAQTQTGGSSTDKKPGKGSTTEPPSQQTNPNNPQTDGDGDGDGENLLAPSTSSGENNCPPRYRIPICATSKLEQDPTQEGGWRREPWDESAASDVLFQQDFCRICSLHSKTPLVTSTPKCHHRIL